LKVKLTQKSSGMYIMENNLDKFVQQLQDQIFEETKDVFGEVVYKRWREPLYMGVLDDPDGHAKVKGTCGDTIEIFLKFEKGRVSKASFQTDGCGPSVVCGSYAAEMAIGKDPDEITEITGNIILEKLGGLPEENEHCAFLAAESLQQALHDFMIKR
jgi:nitrogen fixation protein NifU and related proteins